MQKNARIYIAGHRGLVGSAILRRLQKEGYTHLLLRTSKELDLTDKSAVEAFFAREKPDYVFQCAALVGGILANNNYPADFISTNLAIQTNLIEASFHHQVDRFIFLGSSCIYPRDCPQPIKEEYLLTGPLEFTNRAYALAKIAGVEMCWSYNRQHQTRYLAVMPTSQFGPGDNYDSQNSHVIPALMRKMHEAKEARRPSVTLWGKGSVYREFMHSDDLADALHHLISLPDELYLPLVHSTQEAPIVNIGVGSDITIKDLAYLIKDVVGFEGAIEWDTTKLEGTPRKLMDVTRLSSLGWKAKIPLREGLLDVYLNHSPFQSLVQVS